jgi:hypothetical protein
LRIACQYRQGGFMQRSILATAFSGVMLFSAPASYAMQHGHGGGPPAKAPSVAVHGGTSSHGQSAAHGAAPKAAGGSTHGSSSAATHRSASHPPGDATPKKSPKAGTPAAAKKTKSSSPAPATGTVTLTPVQQKLQHNTNLADKLRTRLPAGTDLMTASAGFKNLGQFVAAVNVSNNLGLKFADLKTHMVTDGMSLGQSIQRLKSTANAETEVRRAEQQATTMINSSTTGTAPAATRKPGAGTPHTGATATSAGTSR